MRKVFVNDSVRLYYELVVSNFSAKKIAVTGVEVLAAADSSVILRYDERAVVSQMDFVDGNDTTNVLRPGQFKLIFIELTQPRNSIPDLLLQRLSIVIAGGNSQDTFRIHVARTNVEKISPLLLALPVSRGQWAAIYNPSWSSGHRRSVYNVNGEAHVPGRHAMDFIKLDDDGKYASGDENITAGWYGYSQDVLAVADGVVSSARDDFSESPLISGHPDYSSSLATGNYISLKIAEGVFVLRTPETQKRKGKTGTEG